ncbi:MAG: imidazolonepropionase [Thermoprotei archaeon]|nr:MAG: imidazolonepropionase [Thermoprotei archaeon]
MRAVRASVLYTGRPHEVLHDVYLVYEGAEVKAITKERPKGVEVVELEGAVVTPAFIDAHCHIGMSRSGEHPSESETNEKYDSVLPLVDALNSVYMDDRAFRESIEFGVLYSCVLPGSGNIIGGRGAVIRNYGADVEEAFIKHAGIKVAFGFNPRSTTDWKGTRPFTRMGAVALLRKWLERAKAAMRLVEQGKKALEEVEPEVRFLFPVVRGEETLRVHVHKSDDIVSLLMLRREYELRAVVDHACDVNSKLTFEKLKREGVPLVYGPIDAFAYKTELRHESYKNVRHLVEVRPLFGLMSDHPVVLQRNLFLQLRFFKRYGMSKSECISVVTLNNARILGVDDVLGTLEPGKWASFVAWSGDPFSLESYPVLVVGEGKVLHEEG